MDILAQRLTEVMSGYAVRGLNGYSVLLSSPDARYFTILSFAEVRGQRHTYNSLVVRLEGDLIVIEEDVNNKPLVEALLQAGLPRAQIVLAYAGEPVPASTSPA
jgi:hypothetical protein